MKKKILSLILALAMVLPLCPVFELPLQTIPVAAATSGYYTYRVSSGETTITDVDTAISGDVTIPSTLGGYPVTSIGISAFRDCTGLTSVTIPDSVTTIRVSAFNGCTSLGTIYITDIAAWCNISFENDTSNPLYYARDLYLNGEKIRDLVIPDGVKKIGDYAFHDCKSLTSIVIPNSVTSIGDYTFRGCENLTSIVIPDSVKNIGNGAFDTCSNLMSIVIPNGITSIKDSTFRYCTGLTSIVIPNSVTSIGNYAFFYCTSLRDIWYEGSSRSEISMGDYNNVLPTWHYNSCMENMGVWTHTYENDCDTTCDECGYTRAITHNYSVQDKDATAHWMKCSVCGTINESTRETHRYDNTCDTTCNTCGQVRTINHDYSVQDKDDTNHWVECSVCGTIDESTRKTHAYDNEFDKRCNECGYERQVVAGSANLTVSFSKCNIVGNRLSLKISISSTERIGAMSLRFDYDPDYLEYISGADKGGNGSIAFADSYDAVYKITKTVVFEAKKTGATTFSPNKLQIVGYDSVENLSITSASSIINIVADHPYDNACDTSCDECGYVREIIHDYSKQDTSNTEHWYKCSVCGTVDESTREAHDFDNACDTTCDECRYVRTITHNYNTQDKNTETHWMKCSICGTIDESSREGHIHTDACDPYCNVCGFFREITHDFSTLLNSEYLHWYVCSVCGTTDDTSYEEHIYDHACDTVCNVCERERTITHSYSIPDLDDTAHWLKCAFCGDIDASTRKTHYYDNACDTTCNGCSFTRAINHDFSVLDKNDSIHWMKCSVCGAIDESSYAIHDYSVLNKNANVHWFTCSVCDIANMSSFAPHVYDHGCDTACNECNAERTVAPHDYSVQDKDAENHWMKCSVCGVVDETTRVAHTHDNACDNECNVCGDTREAPHVYDNACDAKCNDCEAERQVPDHVYDNDEDQDCNECGYVKYTPGDVDGVEGVTLDDAIYFLFHVNFPEFYPVDQPTNFDGKGETDLEDAIYFLFHVNFPEYYPLH